MLTNPLFAGNARLVRAAENAPAMRRGESDREAVRILQNALVGVEAATMRRSIRPDGTLDGDFGSETVQGVKRFQEQHGLVGRSGRGDGIVGRLTLHELDTHAPHTPVPVTVTNGPAPTPRAETSGTLATTSSVRLPTAADMQREYRRFREVRGRPCGRNDIRNQCAIRMSVALMRCDIGFFFDTSHIRWTHSATNRHCGTGIAHNASASRLFPYLRRFWTFQHFVKRGANARTARQIRDAVSGRPGIMYFENCFQGGPNVGGDHIDYWDGSLVMNDLLNYNGPGEREPGDGVTSARFFRNSRRNIWFLPLGTG